MVADLALLVNTESPSHEVDLIDRSAGVLADLIAERLGRPADLVPSAVGAHVHWSGGGEPRVLVLGHHDTVFPIGTVAERPFAVDGNRATGPGVFDMKAGIVQAIHAVAALGDASGVELLFTADEEVGSYASKDLLVGRATACGAVLVLEPSADGGALKIARKGVGTFEVTAHGRAAHAGLEPEKGVNSLVAAAHLITDIVTFAAPERGTTVTPTVSSGGTAENVVPAQTRFKVDVRVEQAGEKERVEALMAALSPQVDGATVSVTGSINRPPMPASASASLFALAVAAAGAIGQPTPEGVAVGGGSDGNFTAAAGIPTLDGLGAVGGGAHADHEYVLLDTMPGRADLLAALIDQISTR
jgi:glutamate carboxypeptidase